MAFATEVDFTLPRGLLDPEGTLHKRGSMRFDFNLMFNPPPNFVEVPRPVVTSVAPIYFVRNEND